MPAATCQAPGSPASSTHTRSPRCAARHALARPIGPPPTTATSGLACSTDSAVHSFPTPARPGSGSTVGAPVAPSQPESRAPVCAETSARAVLDLDPMSAARPDRLDPPVPGLRRAPARLPRRRAARRRRHDPAARQDARRRRADRAPRASSAPRPTPPARCSSSTTGPTSSRRAAPTACTSGQDDGSVAAARAPRSAPSGSSAARRTRRSRAPRPTATPTSTTSRSGPVHATPTKPGRPAAGTRDTSSWAAANVAKPWFAIGGLDAGNVGEVAARGASRIVVVRAIAGGRRPGGRGARAARAPGGPRWGSAAVSGAAQRARAAPPQAGVVGPRA